MAVLIVLLTGLLAAPVTACGSNGSGADTPTGSWTLTSYTNSSGTVPAPDPAATISFTADGRLSGSTGCNTFGGSWSTAGPRLKFSSIGMTARGCVDPAVTTQETAFGIAFSKPQTWSVHGDELTIAAVDGSTSITFTRSG